MNAVYCFLRCCCVLIFGFTVAWGCAFDGSLREYLNLHFWLPFAKHARDFEKSSVIRVWEPFAGMGQSGGGSPLAKLSALYQSIPTDGSYIRAEELAQALSAARSAQDLTPREREEVELIDAKFDLRAGPGDQAGLIERAKKKLTHFLSEAHTPEYLSEARGWLAHAHYLMGEQTEAGKIYLDELNRNGSNLSSETLINSLRMTYGYDGGPELLERLEDYFDTPEHAAFAIHLVTNPRWTDRASGRWQEAVVARRPPYERIKSLLEKHKNLLRSEKGANTLALLAMRTALRAGDPAAVLRIASAVPANASTRAEADFNWMLASARFLSRDYAGAARPLLRVFRSSRSSPELKAAAAYGLCGVYRKTGNQLEQIRFALWLHTQVRLNHLYARTQGTVEDQSVYWASSGWDLGLLLDAEAPIQALRSFVNKYPKVPDVRLVTYSLAVRTARENRFEEASRIYESVNAGRRASRMRQLALLDRQANHPSAPERDLEEARYRVAEFLSANPERVYFNDELWSGLQRYALFAEKDSRLTRSERGSLIKLERRLKDDEDERWRAYLVLRDVVRQSGKTDLGRKAARLAVKCLRGISERFGRESEIRAADIELSSWLGHGNRPATPGIRFE